MTSVTEYKNMRIVGIIVLCVCVVVLVGMCAGPFVGFNKLPSGDDETDKN